MNNQFDDLIYAAGLTAQGCWDEMDEYDRNAILKFAELIVRECAQVSEDDITDGDACCTNTADRIARQIKKHFGVEESRREKFRKSFEEAFKDGVDLSGRETP
jgi:hypothetical protein